MAWREGGREWCSVEQVIIMEGLLKGSVPLLKKETTSPQAPPGIGRECLDLTNVFRAGQGPQPLPALRWDEQLAKVASKHAGCMADGELPFSHAGAQHRFDECERRFVNVAENLARSEGNARDLISQVVVQGWRDSEGHRRNLLGPFDVCGIGWASNEKGVIFVTQLLALVEDPTPEDGYEELGLSEQIGGMARQVGEQAASSNLTLAPALGTTACWAFGFGALGLPGLILAAAAGGVLEHRHGIRLSTLPGVASEHVRRRIQAKLWDQRCSRCGASLGNQGLLEVEQGPGGGTGQFRCGACREDLDPDKTWVFVQ